VEDTRQVDGLYETVLDLLDKAEVTEYSDGLIQRVAFEMQMHPPPPETPALIEAVCFLAEDPKAAPAIPRYKSHRSSPPPGHERVRPHALQWH
jgi:hypothetical protein